MAVPIYRTQDWEAKTKQERFGTTDLSRRQERKFNRYAKSNAGESARLAFDKAEMTKFNDSVDKAVADQVARMRAAYSKPVTKPISNPVTTTPTSSTSTPETPSLVLKNAGYWNQVAGQYGFNDYNAVAEWQRKNGLEADGKFGQASYAKWTQLNPDKVGSAPVIKPKATVTTPTPTPTPVTLVSEEEKAAANAKRAADYQAAKETHLRERQVAKPIPMTADQLRLHSNLRGHHSLAENATIIDGKKYPIVVTTGLLGKDNSLKNDQTYAYDESTGLMRLVNENMFGLPTGSWGEGSVWFDPAKYLGGSEYDWLASNPEPAMYDENNRLSPEYSKWYANHVQAKRSEFKKQGGTMNRINYFQQGGAAPQQQDIKAQVTALVQAAMQGDQKATQTVNQIMEAAKAGDQQAMQIAQLMEQVIKEMQGQATSAKWGTKLSYIRSLKYAKGGKTCPACEKVKQIERKACGGKKALKK